MVTGELPLVRTLLWAVSAIALASTYGKEDEELTRWLLLEVRISEVALALLIGIELGQRDSIVTIAATGASIATYVLGAVVTFSAFGRTSSFSPGGTPEPIVSEERIGPAPEAGGDRREPSAG